MAVDRSAEKARADKHIVDVLIEERATQLTQSPLWPLSKRVLYPILLYRSAVKMADAIAPLPARGVFDYVSALLHLNLEMRGLEHVPEKGRVLIASTHPTGIPDGVAMFDALRERRSDLSFFANRDAIRVAPELKEMVIPVEWPPEKRSLLSSRETLAAAIKAFRDEKCVVLFPSGRLAHMNDEKALTEQPWLSSVAIFARKYDCPVVPAHIEMRNSRLYYWFWRLSEELRDITLFHELLNKKGKRYKIVFGPAIAPSELKGDAAGAAAALRDHAIRGVVAGKPWRPHAGEGRKS
jgi:putative hemolysin